MYHNIIAITHSLIYIPLWFYSNREGEGVRPDFFAIYIPLWFYSNRDWYYYLTGKYRFTFHYGSILMPYSSSQYLPIQLFTFHYGSILILWDRYINIPSVYIYIPLWFYSNQKRSLSIQPTTYIYIPLWFYSNVFAGAVNLAVYLFTFHYGSILMNQKLILLPPLLYLHSTMVLF